MQNLQTEAEYLEYDENNQPQSCFRNKVKIY